MRSSILCAVVFAVACGGGQEKAPTTNVGNEPGPAGANQTNTPAGNSKVSGRVSFTGTAPANKTIDMSEEAACKAKYSSPPTDPVYVVKDGRLANVFVYVKSGLPAGATYAAPEAPAKLDQNGCLYHPRVFGVMVGQKLEIDNSDPLLHNIKAVPAHNRGFNISQPTAGMKTTRTFTTEEIMVPLQCNVHSWMHAYVGVLSHPYFATTGEDGTFTIGGLPKGTYTLEAWHETLGTQTATVTVGDNETKTADFSFKPKA